MDSDQLDDAHKAIRECARALIAAGMSALTIHRIEAELLAALIREMRRTAIYYEFELRENGCYPSTAERMAAMDDS